MNNDKPKPFPSIPEALIKELNDRFPEKCADLDWDDRKVWFYSGQRAVIRFLNQIFQEQRDDSLRSK